ncbi:MAG TPA: hypothetical protein VN451_05950, partial [Chitinophagaceae bacterium]|nr:hypothetical protein [Chitinophagaceae bacterium]
MKRLFSSALLVLSFSLCLPISKKEQLLLLSKKYFPENYTVLKEYGEPEIESLTQGTTLKEFITDVSTVVHEGYHHYIDLHSSYYDTLMLYRINDTLSFRVKNFKTFPSKEISKIVSAATQKKIFRYETYINSESKYHVTQQFGILGLLEECVAYYQSFSTEVALYGYYKDNYGWKKSEPWLNYLGNMASFRFGIMEFELFISWYLQYAKTKHPQTYREIVNNEGLKKLFVFIESENKRLSGIYDANRMEVLKQFNKELEIKDNFIYSKLTYSGKGLYD